MIRAEQVLWACPWSCLISASTDLGLEGVQDTGGVLLAGLAGQWDLVPATIAEVTVAGLLT